MAVERFRILLNLLAASLWGALGFLLTPTLDHGAAWLARVLDPGTGTVAALVSALPWIAWGAVPAALALWWVHARPTWHPWRDAVATAIVWAAGIVGLFVVVNRLDLWDLFHYLDHESVDLMQDGLWLAFPLVVAVPLLVAAFFVGLGAANRIWGTPTPRREATFGEKRGRRGAPTRL